MATERVNDLKAFKGFIDQQLTNGGADLTLDEALARWESANSSEKGKPTLEDLVDLDFEAFCAREGDDSISLQEVREAASRIPGSMAEAIIDDERAERS